MTTRILLISLLALCGRVLHAAPLPTMAVAECDVDRSGTLDRGELSECVAQLDAKILSSSPQSLTACDSDAKGALDRQEAIACFYALDPAARQVAKTPDAWAVSNEVVTALIEDQGGNPVALDVAQGRLEERKMQATKEKPATIGSPFVSIGRKLTDAADPRAAESSVPLILSFTDDRDNDGDAFVAVGAVSYLASARDLSDQWSQMWFLGVESDTTTKKDPSASTLAFSSPLRWSWINLAQRPWIDDLSISAEPKYITDRDFARDVYEIAVPLTFSSARLAKAGLITRFGGDPYNKLSQYRFFWQPSLSVAAGRIADAGGNTDLEALRLKGDYWRVAPGVALKLNLPFADGRVSVAGTYTHRFDLKQDWDHGFVSTSVQYDLTKSVALTATYRHGRKPPDFSATDEFLIGVGLSQLLEE